MRHRLAAILPAYVLLHSLAYSLAYEIRFEFAPSAEWLLLLWRTLPVLLAIKLICALIWGEFRRSFRYASVSDLVTLAGYSLSALAIVWSLNGILHQFIPRSVLCIDACLSLMLIGGLRMSYRTTNEVLRPMVRKQQQQRTLIYGAGHASVGILRMVTTLSPKRWPYLPVAFICDDVQPNQSLIGGLRVHSLSAPGAWSEICAQSGAEALLIPGDTPGRVVRRLFHDCTEHGVQVFVIPTVDDLVDGRFKLTVRDLTVSDLLRREPNQLDMESIRDCVTGRRVMVTGGAGSIGSELCRQIAALSPELLVVYDQSEFGVFSIEQELRELNLSQTEIHYVVADILDERSLTQTLAEFRPQMMFHAAAYKHVPLMEDNPQAAVFNNILGTKAVADAASRFDIERFVLISTDKAVRPTSVMGASKLMAEKYVQALSQVSTTQFITVRFGNVLNSTGSVVPTFRKQIETGGPITVTHPDMQRFFMTIPEAVQLVLQAGAIGESGSVLILDMGEPVRITDLAKDMIMLSGLRYPEDIDIQFTGMRPGEKLYEELFYGSEAGAKKIHEKIYCGDADSLPPLPVLVADIRRLEEAAQLDRIQTLSTLRDIVTRYGDCEWVPSRLPAAA